MLTQQRLEQQRQAAAASNPNDPVDPAAFFQDLPPTLRQSVSSTLDINILHQTNISTLL